VHFRMIAIRTATDRAGADGDDQLGGRHGLIGFLQGETHVLRHGARDQQSVGVARRGHELHAKAPDASQALQPPAET